MKKNNVVMMALLVVVSTNSFSQETYREMASRHMATAGEGMSNAATYAGKKLRYGKKMVSSGLSGVGQWMSANATWAMDTVKGYSRTQQLALVGAIATLLGGAVVIAYLKKQPSAQDEDEFDSRNDVTRVKNQIRKGFNAMSQDNRYGALEANWGNYIGNSENNRIIATAVNELLAEYYTQAGLSGNPKQITEKDVQNMRLNEQPTTSWWNRWFGKKTYNTVS